MKQITTTLLLVLFTAFAFGQNEGEITGKVLDEATKSSIPFAHMKLSNKGVTINELQSDVNGIFVFKPLKPGKYDITVIYMGFDTAVYTGLEVSARGINYQEFLLSEGIGLKEVVIRPPLVTKEITEVITTFTAEDLGNMAIDDITDAIATVAAVQVDERSGGVFVGGSREDATLYVIDGVKVIGSFTLPLKAIQEVNVITGGIPANYGDVTGGIIEITTKGFGGAY